MAYSFGRLSLERLATCAEPLQTVMHAVMARQIMDFAIVVGHRGQADQNLAYARGNSKLQWPHSRHNSLTIRSYRHHAAPNRLEAHRAILLASRPSTIGGRLFRYWATLGRQLGYGQWSIWQQVDRFGTFWASPALIGSPVYANSCPFSNAGGGNHQVCSD